MVNKIETGNRIKQIRLSKGDTLEEFGVRIARVLNIPSRKAPSKSNVSKWEAGSSLPNKTRLKAIADIGEITVEELLYGSPNVTVSVDIEQSDNLVKYVDSKRQVIKQELDLFKKSAVEGLFSGIGLAKGLGDKGVEDYKRHEERIKDLEIFGKKYIEIYYDNYTYEKYLQDYPNSDPEGFQEYKDKEWEVFKEVLDNFWEAYDISATYSIDDWINKRFTDQIREKLLEILAKADNSHKVDNYINELVQPILDEAANEINNINITDIE